MSTSSKNTEKESTEPVGNEKRNSTSAKATEERPECFVIMPIGTPDGYTDGHFTHVYHDILKPACEKAGFNPVRGDEVNASNMIHLDILQRLLQSPMAICDLSSRNPNVLFELGMRQAFNMPVALVREVGTPRIFDIEPLRYVDYRKELIYHEVLADQKKITEMVKDTFQAHKDGKGINSLVKLLSLTQSASLVEVSEIDKDPMMQLVRAEITSLRQEIISLLPPNSASGVGLGNNRITRRRTVTPSSVGLPISVIKSLNANETANSWKTIRRQVVAELMNEELLEAAVALEEAELTSEGAALIISLNPKDYELELIETLERVLLKFTGKNFVFTVKV